MSKCTSELNNSQISREKNFRLKKLFIRKIFPLNKIQQTKRLSLLRAFSVNVFIRIVIGMVYMILHSQFFMQLWILLLAKRKFIRDFMNFSYLQFIGVDNHFLHYTYLTSNYSTQNICITRWVQTNRSHTCELSWLIGKAWAVL